MNPLQLPLGKGGEDSFLPSSEGRQGEVFFLIPHLKKGLQRTPALKPFLFIRPNLPLCGGKLFPKAARLSFLRNLSGGETGMRERKEKPPGTPEFPRWVAVFRLERAVFLEP